MAGRPTKVIKFIEAMKALYSKEGVSLVVLTDLELWRKVNSTLPREDRVSKSTFEFWKSPTSSKSVVNMECISDEDKEEFIDTLELFRIDAKLELGKRALRFEKSENSQAAMVLLSKKFADFKEDNTITVDNKTIAITVGQQSHKNLIESISGDATIDIEHDEIKEIQKRLGE